MLTVHMGMVHAAPCVCAAGEAVEVHTVFQIAGPETPGLLAEVTQLLSHNGLEIRTAAVSSGQRYLVRTVTHNVFGGMVGPGQLMVKKQHVTSATTSF
jgi:hypothetical protein